jgi:uncharacterized protein YfaS (alpha-2-macroglobulin family)
MNLRGFASLSPLALTVALVVFGVRSIDAGEIVSVYPTGSVKQVQQVTVKFSTDMVAMGDPRSKVDPAKMECNEAASKKAAKIPRTTTRWADTKTWSLDFDKPLGAGVKCTLTLSASAKDLAGQAVTGTGPYTFSTSGPALLGVAPQYGNIEPDQYFVLQLDGEIDLKSLEANAYFEAEGIPDKIGVRVIGGRDRETVIGAAIKDNWNWTQFQKFVDEKKFGALKDFLVIAGKRRFPEDKAVTLHWTKGIRSKSGLPVEEEQSFDFHTVPPFEAKLNCDRTAAERPCNPILDISIGFTSRLKLSRLKGAKLVATNGQTWVPVEFAKKSFVDEQVNSLTFKGPFPEKTKFQVVLPKGLKDELGRTLINENKFPLETATDEYSPLLKFAATFGILELHADPALPVSVRNVEKQLPGSKLTFEGKSFVLGASSAPREIIHWIRDLNEKDYSYEKRDKPLLGGDGRGKNAKPFSLTKPGGEREFELVGIPFKEPGLHIVEFSSPRLGSSLLGAPTPMYVASGALVTNLSVHLKKGRESSAVWVTALDTGKPVANANVGLYDHDGRQLAKGTTDTQGLWRVGRVAYPCQQAEEGEDEGAFSSCEVFAFAKLGDDFSFVSSQWSRGIEEYRFNLTREYLAAQWGPVLAHTILDRALVQAGDSINMKHLLREHTGMGFRALNPKRLPKHVLIVHSGSRKTYTLNFDYDKATGSALSTFKVPKDAALGTYEIYLSNKADLKASADSEDAFDWSALNTGHFLVSEYRLPLMEATVKIQGAPLIQPKEAAVDMSANYLSGGPASGLKVKLRAGLDFETFTPDVPGASDYTFFSEPTKAGTTTEDRTVSEEEKYVSLQDLVLDKAGGLKATVKKIPALRRVRALVVEMEYRDPNGEIKTASSRQTIYPGAVIVGLKSDSWMSEPGKVAVQGIVTDQAGHILPNRTYTVSAFSRQDLTHRKRLVGGFYAYDSQVITKSLGQVCTGQSDRYGRFVCNAKDIQPGQVILEAKASDDKGRSTYASVSMSVYGSDRDFWWTPSDSDRIDLIPEKTRYEPGEKALFTVRSPFPKSTVLITVEREGILDSFVREISREQPTVEVPIKPNYGPNVFVSALAVRGRVGEPQATALIDLAKPSMKLGMSEIKVGWKAHELKVTVTTDKKRYQVREKAQATIRVVRATDGKPMAGGEIAVVAVDESLERLRRNGSFDLLSVMMGQRGLAVDTATSQNQVIGKRHFGSKAKAPGGGGGKAGDDSRQLFDPLLLWSARVKLDQKGEAKVVVPLNDSLTSFKIMAAATGGFDLFGDGSTRIESTKDLILYSGFAPLVREGDKISNRFTVRNTTEKSMNVSVTVSSAEIKSLPAIQGFKLAGGEAKTLEIPVTIPAGLREATFDLSAKDGLSGATDAMKAKVKIAEAVPDRVLMATLFQLEKPVSLPVKQPSDAIPGRGGVNVQAQETLVRGLATMKSYMSDYPYSCLEQKVSKAIVSENRTNVQGVIEQLPSYFDSSGLLKFFPSSMCGSAQLNRYVFNILQESGYSLPQATLDQGLTGLQSWLNGRDVCRSWWDTLIRDNYRDQERILVMETLSRYKKFDAKDLATIKIAPNLWTTEAVVAWFRLLSREPAIASRDSLLKQAENILRARVNYQGSSMTLQGKLDWEGRWMLFSSPDQEAIGVFGVAIDTPTWSTDAGKMARGVIARMNKGVWDTTLANAWALTTLRRFSQKFENVKVTGQTVVTSPGSAKHIFDWAKSPSGGDVRLAWPPGSVEKPVDIAFKQEGTGKPWMLLQTRSAIPLKAPWDLGYRIARKLIPITQKVPRKWSDGDVVNVEITIFAKYDQPWVVVRDPIPAGATHLGSGLEGTSRLLNKDPKVKKDANSPDDFPTEYEEKGLENYIAYAAYLPKGTYRLNYRIRLNSSGTFRLPPSRVEALYSPETFGESPNGPWIVSQ